MCIKVCIIIRQEKMGQKRDFTDNEAEVYGLGQEISEDRVWKSLWTDESDSRLGTDDISGSYLCFLRVWHRTIPSITAHCIMMLTCFNCVYHCNDFIYA